MLAKLRCQTETGIFKPSPTGSACVWTFPAFMSRDIRVSTRLSYGHQNFMFMYIPWLTLSRSPEFWLYHIFVQSFMRPKKFRVLGSQTFYELISRLLCVHRQTVQWFQLQDAISHNPFLFRNVFLPVLIKTYSCCYGENLICKSKRHRPKYRLHFSKTFVCYLFVQFMFFLYQTVNFCSNFLGISYSIRTNIDYEINVHLSIFNNKNQYQRESLQKKSK